MFRTRLIEAAAIASLALSLAACGAGGPIDMDAQGAISAAQAAAAAGDPTAAVRAQCYQALDGVALQQPKGVLSKFESTVELRTVAEGQCAPIVAGLGVHLLDKQPFTP